MLLRFSLSNRMRYLLWCLTFFCGVSVAFSIDVTKHPHWSLLEHRRCGNSNTDRIIGGKNASLGAYPWIARIGFGKSDSSSSSLSYRCGGTLINSLYVVTAAHCVVKLPNDFQVKGVRLGEHNTLTDPDCDRDYCADPVQDFVPKSIISHKGYNDLEYKHDIAIIRLNRPAIYNEFVSPICIMSGKLMKKNFIGETTEVAGWGVYDINNPRASTILQTVKLPVVEMNRCRQAFKSFAQVWNQLQMCAGGVVGEDSCGGDSGGPLMKVMNLKGPPRYYFLGIVSYGAKACGASTTPAIYSKVAAYTTWILRHISP